MCPCTRCLQVSRPGVGAPGSGDCVVTYRLKGPGWKGGGLARAGTLSLGPSEAATPGVPRQVPSTPTPVHCAGHRHRWRQKQKPGGGGHGSRGGGGVGDPGRRGRGTHSGSGSPRQRLRQTARAHGDDGRPEERGQDSAEQGRPGLEGSPARPLPPPASVRPLRAPDVGDPAPTFPPRTAHNPPALPRSVRLRGAWRAGSGRWPSGSSGAGTRGARGGAGRGGRIRGGGATASSTPAT